jgi:hypothetical protein
MPASRTISSDKPTSVRGDGGADDPGTAHDDAKTDCARRRRWRRETGLFDWSGEILPWPMMSFLPAKHERAFAPEMPKESDCPRRVPKTSNPLPPVAGFRFLPEQAPFPKLLNGKKP